MACDGDAASTVFSGGYSLYRFSILPTWHETRSVLSAKRSIYIIQTASALLGHNQNQAGNYQTVGGVTKVFVPITNYSGAG